MLIRDKGFKFKEGCAYVELGNKKEDIDANKKVIIVKKVGHYVISYYRLYVATYTHLVGWYNMSTIIIYIKCPSFGLSVR